MADVMKRLEEIERDLSAGHQPPHYTTFLLKLTRALLESQGELLPLARDAEQYYNNRMGDCACYRSCKHCEAWDKKQRAAREVIASAEKVRKEEV